MFEKKPTEQKFEFINEEIKFSEKRNSSVVCVVPIPKHLKFCDYKDGYVELIDPASIRTMKKGRATPFTPLIRVSIHCEKKCSSFNELRNHLNEGLKKYPTCNHSTFVDYDIKTSCERNEIISTKSLHISSSYDDDLVSYYDSYDHSFNGKIDITFYSYTLMRGNMFRFSLSISREILSKKYTALRRDKHEVRTDEDWLRSYVRLFRQKNGALIHS